jgi:hypothetical protein
VVAAAIALLAAPVGAAAAQHTVVLFAPSAADPLAARLDAELAAVGIAVRHVAPRPGADVDALATAAIAGGAGAAIRVMPQATGTEVWTAEPSARVRRRQSIVVEPADAALVALRTVELVRASLLELRKRSGATPPPAPPASTPAATSSSTPPATAPPRTPPTTSPPRTPGAEPPKPDRSTADTGTPPPSGERAPAPPKDETSDEVKPPLPPEPPKPKPDQEAEAERAAAKVEPPTDPRVELALGPALLASRGGMAPLLGFGIGARTRFVSRAGAELTLLLPASSAQVTDGDAAADVRVALLAVGGHLRLTSPGRVVADAGAGVAVLMLHAAGIPQELLRTTSSTAWGWGGVARLGAALNLRGPISVRLDLFGGAAVYRPVVTFVQVGSQTDVASWGRPFAAGTLSLAAGF